MQSTTMQLELTAENLTEILNKLKLLYNVKGPVDEKTQQIISVVKKFGYLPFAHQMALEELTPEQTILALEEKFNQNNIYENNSFVFEDLSAVKRAGFKDSSWVQAEQHSIKLVNLAALGNGNEVNEPAKFIDVLKQILILPAGNLEKGVLSTTMYIIPFHPREFGCAYLPTSTEVSPALEDKFIKENLGLCAKEQVQLLLAFAQLAGHPLMYDVLPQTGRFSKPVLANPQVARWFDIKGLILNLKEALAKYSCDENVKEIVSAHLDGNYVEIPEELKESVHSIEKQLDETRKTLCEAMIAHENQLKLHSKAKQIINSVLGYEISQNLTESNVNEHGKVIGELINIGLWPSPGGAWNSAGIPIFDKMAEGAGYPKFKHYDFEGNDVSKFANLDCQTPYYFVNLENGNYNEEVIQFYIEYLKKLQQDYNFDSFRVDHIDHIVDKVSEDNGRPLSYRAPRTVLAKANLEMKNTVEHFAVLAEYMLWDNFLKEYHQDMNFDLLWGSDIVSQYKKNPKKIEEELIELEEYNKSVPKDSLNLSILKIYNNQDGEFREIDQYPGQLGEDGALFKWFKFKFMPLGKDAQRPVLYMDGDESFTKTGTEHVIGNEVSMKRENNYDFYAKFDAISRFAINSDILRYGRTEVLDFDQNGFTSWIVRDTKKDEAILVLANYFAPAEKVRECDENGNMVENIKGGIPVFNINFEIPKGYEIVSQIKYDKEISDFVEIDSDSSASIEISKLKPSRYKIFKLKLSK